MKDTHYKYIISVLFSCLLISCGGPKVVSPVLNETVAIWELADYSAEDQMTTEMGELMTARIMQTFQRREGVTVIEREKLALALGELNIGSSEMTDTSARLEIGKILGARYMVFGGYQVFGGLMRIDIRLVDVETGKIVKATEETVNSSNVSQWMTAAEKAAQTLAESI